MANARAIVKRRKAVANIRRITHTMQLIATARYQQMLGLALATKPYTEGITRLVSQLSQAGEEIEHPLLNENEGANRSALIVLSSNRGLCAGYNAGILRVSLGHIHQQEQAGATLDTHAVGKKAVNYFRFLGRDLVSANTTLPDWPPFSEVEPLADEMIAAYTNQALDAVYVAYTRFISVGKQQPEVIQLLPIERKSSEDADDTTQAKLEYEFSPPAKDLLADLLPSYVKVRLYQCFTDAAVSEQIARMVAMKAATDAADDMHKLLGQRYNRARQSQITSELLDIMGGAEALK